MKTRLTNKDRIIDSFRRYPKRPRDKGLLGRFKGYRDELHAEARVRYGTLECKQGNSREGIV